MVKTIKQIHKEDIVMIKIGNFYHVYGKDALYKIRVEKIYNYMKENISKKECREMILKVEEMIDERRKIQSN